MNFTSLMLGLKLRLTESAVATLLGQTEQRPLRGAATGPPLSLRSLVPSIRGSEVQTHLWLLVFDLPDSWGRDHIWRLLHLHTRTGCQLWRWRGTKVTMEALHPESARSLTFRGRCTDT